MTDTNPPVVKRFTLKRTIPAIVLGAIVYSVLYRYFAAIMEPLVKPLAATAIILTMISCTNAIVLALQRLTDKIAEMSAKQLAELEKGDETQEIVH